MSRTYVNFTTETHTDRVRAVYGDEIYDRLARAGAAAGISRITVAAGHQRDPPR